MTQTISITYFAALADQLGCTDEQLSLPENALSVQALKHLLAQRSEAWSTAILAPTTKCAVNQVIATDEQEVFAGNEVAFFPPVTGG